MIKKLEKNLKLFPFFMLSQRRLFSSIVGIYFLTLPGASQNIHMLGWFVASGSLLSFLFEIPSGYFSDMFGHKKALVLSKILMMSSTLLYIFANHWVFFLLGSIFIFLGFSFQSGTWAAITHNTLNALGREKEYVKVFSKMSANVSIISAFLIVIIIFFIDVDILIPFYVVLFLDVIGLLTVFSIFDPKKDFEKKDVIKKSITEIYKESKSLGFLSFSIFMGILAGTAITSNTFRELHLLDLALPISFIGLLTGLSRLVWFVVGHNAYKIERRFSIKSIFIFRMFLTPTIFILFGIISNPYIALILLSINIGFWAGISSIFKKYFLDNFVPDQRYKATMLSIESQIGSIFEIIFSLVIGYAMLVSYSFGFVSMGVMVFISFIFTWYFLRKRF